MENQSRVPASKMSPAQFSQSIKQKYPQYSDMDDFELANAMISKYPQYADKVQARSTGEKMADSFKKSFRDIGKNPALQAPIGLAKSGADLISGVGELGQRGLRAITPQFNRDPNRPIAKLPDAMTEAEGGFQQAGKLIGDIASFATPGGATARAGKFAELLASGSKVPKFVSKTAGLGARVGTEAGIAGGITSLQQGDINEESKGAAIMGAAFPIAAPIVGKVAGSLNKGRKTLGGRLINSLVKPKNKDLAYGKNPGATVAKLGITANTKEELAKKVDDALSSKMNQLTSELEASGAKFDLTDVAKPLDDAMAKAVENNDQTVINALNKAKQALTQTRTLVDGEIKQTGSKVLNSLGAKDAVDLKRKIGELTKFTGNPSDDKAVNAALQNAYRLVKQRVDEAVPMSKNISGEIADLISAKNAIKGRLDQETRNNMLGLGTKIIGTGVAGGTLAGGGAIAGGQDPASVAKALLTGVAVGGASAFAGSTALKTRLAKILAKEGSGAVKNNPLVKTQLERLFGKKFSESEINKISNEVKSLKNAVGDKRGIINPSAMADSLGLSKADGAYGLIKKASGDVIDSGDGLIVTHNITPDKLKKAIDAGGLSAPSLAITKQSAPVKGYGDIIFVGNKKMVDPKGKNIRTFSDDIYSMRFPEIIEKNGRQFIKNPENKTLKAMLNESPIFKKLFNSEDVLKDIDQFDMWIQNEQRFVNEAERLANKLGFNDMYDLLEDMNSADDLIPATSENISKIIRDQVNINGEIRNTEGFSPRLDSVLARELKSLEDIKKNKTILGTMDEVEKARKLIQKDIDTVDDIFGGFQKGTYPTEIIRDAGALEDPSKMMSVFNSTRYEKKINIDEAKKLVKAYKNIIKNSKVNYFETKNLNPVKLKEFDSVLVPNDIDNELLKSLQNEGVKIIRYSKDGKSNTLLNQISKLGGSALSIAVVGTVLNNK